MISMAYDRQCETLRFVRRNNSFRFRFFFRLVDARNETGDVLLHWDRGDPGRVTQVIDLVLSAAKRASKGRCGK